MEFFGIVHRYNCVCYGFFQTVLYVFRPIIGEFAVRRKIPAENTVDEVNNRNVRQS
jgi:hypothetical protein